VNFIGKIADVQYSHVTSIPALGTTMPTPKTFGNRQPPFLTTNN
jgi:hypothetical protein